MGFWDTIWDERVPKQHAELSEREKDEDMEGMLLTVLLLVACLALGLLWGFVRVLHWLWITPLPL